jgi:UDP-glucose 4-epimerase
LPHVVVTGGAGFIGSHIVDAYVARGWRVTVVDDLSSGSRANLHPDAHFIHGDVSDPSFLDGSVDVVSHHAAQVDVRKSVTDPAFDAEQNIVASVRLFQRAAETNVKKIVFASSGGAAYGEPVFVPQNEEHPFAPMSPYGIAKAAVEYYLEFFRNVHGIATVALRYGNVYGPRQRADGEAGVLAIFGAKMLRGEEVVINGDGEQTRDYVFVEDVVRANMAVSDSELTGAFNVGTGVETTVNELAGVLAAALDVPLRTTHGPAKPGEQKRSVLDGTKIRRAAGLPEPVAFGEGVRRTVEWLRATAS